MKALGVLLVVASVALGACGSDTEVGLAGQVRTPSPNMGGVSLPEVTGGMERDFTFTAQPGGLLLVYWGYTGCPDICPTTLAELRKALRATPEDDAAKVDIAFVTIDPERDTGEIMTAYIHAFFPDKGIAIRTTDQDALKAAADEFGAKYTVEIDDKGDVYVEHSAWVYVLDDTGTLLVSWPFGLDADSIAGDIEALLKETST